MPEIQRVYEVVQDVRPAAIVIHCSDPRLQNAFGQFIRDELGLKDGQYIPIVVGGGAGALARPITLPKEFKFIRDRLELTLERFRSVKRIILINHQDCEYYDALGDRVLGLLAKFAKRERPHEDMKGIAKVFTSLLSHLGVSVELYYARFADDTHTQIVFEKVAV